MVTTGCSMPRGASSAEGPVRMPGPWGSGPPRGGLRAKPAPAGSAPRPGTPQRLAPGCAGQTRLLRPETHEALPAGPPSAPRPKQALTEGRPGKRPPWAEARWASGPNEGALRGLSRCCRAARPPAGQGPGPRSPLARRSLAAPRVHGARAGPRVQARGLSPRLWLPARAPRSPRSAAGPPLGRFRFRFPAAVVEENESDRGRGPGPRSSRRGEGRRDRRRSAWSLRAGAAARTRRGGSTPWTSLPCKQSPGWTTEKQENGLPAAVCNVSICGEDCLQSISTPFALNRQ